MIAALRRKLNVVIGVASVTPKVYLAYSGWVWLTLFSQALVMTIFLFYWRAVYENATEVGGLTYQQTINYVLLVQAVGASIWTAVIPNIGYLVREGQIGVEFVRPVDFQFQQYIRAVAQMVVGLILNLPLFVLAVAYGAQLPADPLVYAAFLVSLILGFTVLFLFDWVIASVTFYTMEVWGLMVLHEGFWLFFSGSLIPLNMMPDPLRTLATMIPFSQASYVPMGILSGTIPLSEAPLRWLTQAVWVGGLWVVSRTVFSFAARRVTVQGG